MKYSSVCAIVILLVACKPKQIETEMPATTTEIISKMKSKKYAGIYQGKSILKLTSSDSVQTFLNTGKDTLGLLEINNKEYRFKKVADSNNYLHDLSFISRNDDLEYLFFRGRICKEDLLTNLPVLVNDHFQYPNTGPESALVYYFTKDSIVYFENFSPNMGTSNLYPYTNYYKLCNLKGM